jgi:hypothetical protein
VVIVVVAVKVVGVQEARRVVIIREREREGERDV